MESKPILMTINGRLTLNQIDVEMLCFSIFPDDRLKKFVGYNNIYWYNPNYYKHSDESKDFFNQISFYFDNKIIIKLYLNGSIQVAGCKNENDFHEKLNILLEIINKPKYIYIPESNELISIWKPNQQIKLLDYKIALMNFSIDLNPDLINDYEFNTYYIWHIQDILDDDEKNIIESLNDGFRFACVSIKFKDFGNIDFFRKKITVSCKHPKYKDYLISFYEKYKLKLISKVLKLNVDKINFLQNIAIHKGITEPIKFQNKQKKK